MDPVIIIGNGIAGISCARHLRKRSNVPICIVSEESPYFFARTALMYVYMGHMPKRDLYPYEKSFWKKNRLDRIQERVVEIRPEEKTIVFQSGKTQTYSRLVLALGSKARSLPLPGSDLQGVRGLYHWHDLEALEAHTPKLQQASIIGGGLIGVELAEMLHSRGIEVDFWVRESSFWNTVLPPEESAIINQHIESHGIRLHLNAQVEALRGDDEGAVSHVLTADGREVPAQWVGATIGVEPNIRFLENSSLETDRGILVNEYLESSWPDVYAIGDCAQQKNPPSHRRAIEAVWYTGRMMGETLALTLSGRKQAYSPGPCFNSAKIFDIEYQTYGQLSAQADPKNESQLFWQHPSAAKLIRWSFHPETRLFLGVNSLGIRLRHEYFHNHLLAGSTIDQVISGMQAAYFDPEFYPNYHPSILKTLNSY